MNSKLLTTAFFFYLLTICLLVSAQQSPDPFEPSASPSADYEPNSDSPDECVSPSFSRSILPRKQTLRVATFNAALSRSNADQLRKETRFPNSTQIQRVAATIQHIDPDIILLNEVDFDSSKQTYNNLRTHYFSVPQTQYQSTRPIVFPYYYAPFSNTGVLSNVDINNDSRISIPSDAYGFGRFPGQYGMVMFSKYPIDFNSVRTFQQFRWIDMPRNRFPFQLYSQQVADVFRLSSKNHIDVPVVLPSGRYVHILGSHPTPPVFDSAQFDENGRRNADEIRFWSDYITPKHADYIYDDTGVTGGFTPRHNTSNDEDVFFICGDLNADPYDGDGITTEISSLLARYNVLDPRPSSIGAEQSENNIEKDAGDPKYDTSYFSRFVGNLRVDYVIPSANVRVDGAHVFWPGADDPLAMLVNGSMTSDHRAVFVDVTL